MLRIVVSAVLFGSLMVILVGGSEGGPRQFRAHIGCSGIHSEQMGVFCQRMVKEVDNGIYQFDVHCTESIEQSEQMRYEHLGRNEGKSWSPVYICDFSDDTIFDRIRINQLAFDNEQLHMRRVLNQGNQKGHVKWQSPKDKRDTLIEKYPRIHFNFRFDEWDSGLTAKDVIDGFEHAIKDGSGNPKWDIHTGKDILSALKGDSQYFGIESEAFDKAVDQAFQSNDLALSKSFYAFNKENQSGVIFIGELHNHDRFIDMELSIIESLMPWLDTLFTEANALHFHTKLQSVLLSRIQKKLESIPEINFELCPMRDSTQSNLSRCLLNLPNNAKYSHSQAFHSLPLMESLSGIKYIEHFIAEMDFGNPSMLRSKLWEQQYRCATDRVGSTSLIRSMMMFSSLEDAIKPHSLAVVIQGSSHALDILLAMQGTFDKDLLRDHNNIPSDDTLVSLKRRIFDKIEPEKGTSVKTPKLKRPPTLLGKLRGKRVRQET